MPELELISHYLCPYVQRSRIVLAEKSVPHTLTFIDLGDKPDWFLQVSPLGKVPVLLVDRQPVFESAVIVEYLDEITAGSLHPSEPLERARHRSWIAFASSTLDNVAGFYNAAERSAWARQRQSLRDKFRQLQCALAAGPFFAGAEFSLVDAAFAPLFRYFEVFEDIGDFGFFDDTPRIAGWRAALAARASVRDAVVADYHDRLLAFLARRGSYLSARIAARKAA
jgi:glutathione S-transferase